MSTVAIADDTASRRRRRVRKEYAAAGLFDELIVDEFAGGGGVSMGIEIALGRAPDLAVNHNRHAIEMHRINHPTTRHICQDVWLVDPREVTHGRPVGLAWFSPDCRHFSRAKGGKPVTKKIRGLAWVAVRWAQRVRPRVIIIENVREFQDWGPLGTDSRPIAERKGETFRRFCGQLRTLGYAVEWRELNAADHGAPTHRRRLFLVARCDGRPIRWPAPTHGPKRPHAWKTAGECIDWSIPCPSIFERRRPLADNTLRRIAMGLRRFVLEDPAPFIVQVNHGRDAFRGQRVDQPLPTVSAKHGFGLVVPHIAQYFGGMVGKPVDAPLPTVTAIDHNALVAAFLTKFYGTSCGQRVDRPMPTVSAQGNHVGEVRAFLVKYYGCGVGQSVKEPIHTLTSKDRMGLVTVAGQDYQIADIGLRMLTPRELARAQSFPDDYRLSGTKSQQVAMIGNSVPPLLAAAVVRANCGDELGTAAA